MTNGGAETAPQMHAGIIYNTLGLRELFFFFIEQKCKNVNQ